MGSTFQALFSLLTPNPNRSGEVCWETIALFSPAKNCLIIGQFPAGLACNEVRAVSSETQAIMEGVYPWCFIGLGISWKVISKLSALSIPIYAGDCLVQLVKDERLVKEEVLLLQDRGKQRSIALKGGYIKQKRRAGEVQLFQTPCIDSVELFNLA